ncbi:hypothetical protein D0T90_01645 [Neisseria animalis]|uniref:Uncharacterized protein n=1 Tax=Neisseria animalis TaxID=492 RepID=A0A5P3MPA2_NEIAN|nr:hypothetical protein D0T90_01645 [Neisseria animalis]ROW33210.1 hypothetical protein CGZ60_00380 [Neisseria animalis]
MPGLVPNSPYHKQAASARPPPVPGQGQQPQHSLRSGRATHQRNRMQGRFMMSTQNYGGTDIAK